MADPHVLVVTSAGSPSSAVVPVLAAIEAAGMRVRAIDVGGAGGGGGGMADRVKRALLGEGAERRLRKELEISPPDASVVFDPHAALALTVARDQSTAPSPVIGVVADLEPAATWAQTDCDRFIAVDDLAAVALADAGVEGERILVVGAIGERAFAEAGGQDRAALRTRFKLGGKVALVEVAGLGAEPTGQLALQLSLLDGNDQIAFLFDAGSDVEAAAVLRRQVPALGLRAKLFGATADAPLLWRAADVVVARPRPEVVARVMLVGAKLVALVDDTVPGAARVAAALEGRKRARVAKGLLLLSSALDAALGGAAPPPTGDGADHAADIVAAVAGDRRAVVDERRAAAHAATRDRVRAVSAAAQAVAATAAMPGELEDLGGGGGGIFDGGDDDDGPAMPDPAELARLRNEVKQRVAELTRSMTAARGAAGELGDQAKAASARGATDEAAGLQRKADAESARMHALLAELATLEKELGELERVAKVAAEAPKVPPRATPPRPGGEDLSDSGDMDAAPPPRAPPRSLDDELAALKRGAGAGPVSAAPRPAGSGLGSGSAVKPRTSTTVEDELAALKRKMAAAPSPPPKKK